CHGHRRRRRDRARPGAVRPRHQGRRRASRSGAAAPPIGWRGPAEDRDPHRPKRHGRAPPRAARRCPRAGGGGPGAVRGGEATGRFRAHRQGYKVQLTEDLVRDQGVETVSLYSNGSFTDLCRGPHSPSTGRIPAFKLQSVAGAYWRGDATQPMLTRVYGTAFFSKPDLEEHLERLERARANDHRRLGPQLGLFTFSDVSPGAAFWLPAGTEVFNSLVAL